MTRIVCRSSDSKSRKPIGTPEINREWVSQNFGVVVRGTEVEVCCPVHGEKNASCRINVDKGLYFCHGCGSKGTLIRLAKSMKVPYAGSSETGMDVNVLYAKLDKLTHGRRDKPTSRFLAESHLKRYEFPTNYWTGCGLTQDTIEAFDLGYDVMADAATIPVRSPEGHLIGITRRFLSDPDYKYKDPKGFVKGENLFASWLVAADEAHTAVLTEGPKDAMKVWQAGHAAMAQYGSHVSLHQIRLMRQLGIVTLILFYDNDKAGDKCFEEAIGLTYETQGRKRVQVYNPERDLSRFFILKRVRYSSKAKDPGELADRTIDAMIRNAEFYSGSSA